jgi:hypothetical protein
MKIRAQYGVDQPITREQLKFDRIRTTRRAFADERSGFVQVVIVVGTDLGDDVRRVTLAHCPLPDLHCSLFC